MSYDNEKKELANGMSAVFMVVVTVIVIVASISGYQIPQNGLSQHEHAALAEQHQSTT